MSTNKSTLLSLTRMGIGHGVDALPQTLDWYELKNFAVRQGVSAIVLDGIEELRKSGVDIGWPNKELLTQWIGEVLQGYELRYEMYCRTIAEMACFYNHHGFKMMVLKGYACSLNWPKPEHRPCGDIDIWQFGQQKEADDTLGIGVNHEEHHHTVFYWRGFMVENHYDFVNVHYGHGNDKMETILKALGQDDSHYTEIDGEKVYLPSPNLHALFLIRHSILHFASTEMNLRQILDWAFFVEKHGKEVDWKWLQEILEKFHMTDFFNILNAICIEDLGFDAAIFPAAQVDKELKNRVMNDTLSPEFQEQEPKGLIPRVRFKYRRWKTNGWKRKLCYNESSWSAFWSGVWNHLLKPKSI